MANSSGGLLLCSSPIPVVAIQDRVISGDYTGNFQVDRENYCEIIDLKGLGIYNFMGLNINGITYDNFSDIVEYNKSLGTVKVKGFKIVDNDEICIIFNKLTDDGGYKAKADSITLTGIPYSIGDYSRSEESFTQVISVSGLPIAKFVGLAVDTVLYCHPNKVSYNENTREITIRGEKLEDANEIVILYNTKL